MNGRTIRAIKISHILLEKPILGYIIKFFFFGYQSLRQPPVSRHRRNRLVCPGQTQNNRQRQHYILQRKKIPLQLKLRPPHAILHAHAYHYNILW